MSACFRIRQMLVFGLLYSISVCPEYGLNSSITIDLFFECSLNFCLFCGPMLFFCDFVKWGPETFSSRSVWAQMYLPTERFFVLSSAFLPDHRKRHSIQLKSDSTLTKFRLFIRCKRCAVIRIQVVSTEIQLERELWFGRRVGFCPSSPPASSPPSPVSRVTPQTTSSFRLVPPPASSLFLSREKP